jgi:hypothetical protein
VPITTSPSVASLAHDDLIPLQYARVLHAVTGNTESEKSPLSRPRSGNRNALFDVLVRDHGYTCDHAARERHACNRWRLFTQEKLTMSASKLHISFAYQGTQMVADRTSRCPIKLGAKLTIGRRGFADPRAGVEPPTPFSESV